MKVHFGLRDELLLGDRGHRWNCPSVSSSLYVVLPKAGAVEVDE